MSSVFEASYPGICTCGASFDFYDEIYFDDDHDLVAVECCGPPEDFDDDDNFSEDW